MKKIKKTIVNTLIGTLIVSISLSSYSALKRPIEISTDTPKIINEVNEVKYEFENKIFETQEEVVYHAMKYSEKQQYSFENIKLLLDGKVFLDNNQLQEYLDTMFFYLFKKGEEWN